MRFLLLVLILLQFSCSQNSSTYVESIKKNSGESITIVSWNIQDFGKTITDNQMNEIAGILNDADIVALQEVVAGYGGSQAVARLNDELNRKGYKWDYSISNPTNSGRKKERYAFLWKTSSIKIKRKGSLIEELSQTVLREPFLQSFYYNQQEIKVLNFHSKKFSDHPENEIPYISSFIKNNQHNNWVLLSDFNLKSSHPVFNEFKNIGFNLAFKNIKTTLKRKCKFNRYTNHAIDHIFLSKNIKLINGGAIDFIKNCQSLAEKRLISDHLPIFCQISIE